MLENEVEKYLVDYAELKGCKIEKLILKDRRGWPDRTIITPHGVTGFAEVKRPRGGKLSPQQTEEIAGIANRKTPIAIIKNKKEAKEFVDYLLTLRLSNV